MHALGDIFLSLVVAADEGMKYDSGELHDHSEDF